MHFGGHFQLYAREQRGICEGSAGNERVYNYAPFRNFIWIFPPLGTM